MPYDLMFLFKGYSILLVFRGVGTRGTGGMPSLGSVNLIFCILFLDQYLLQLFL